MAVEVSSPEFQDGGTIPVRYTGDGEDVSPPLRWSGVPGGSAELAVLVEDPDAPGGTFVHWMLTGLDADSGGLEEGSVPPATSEGLNGFGRTGWAGPQPPPGDGPHRYVFTVLALSEPAGMAPGATPDEFHDAVQGKEVGRGQLVGRYER